MLRLFRALECIGLILAGIFFMASFVFSAIYPLEVIPVDRESARYDTPEDAYTSMISSLINEDINWYYTALTAQSAKQENALYKKYNVEHQAIFSSVKNIEQIRIIDKKNHADGVWLIVETINTDGSALTGPSLFVLENGMWKSHQKVVADDDPILDYLYYVPPLFYGKGQKPDDVNSFMGYEQPKQDRLELEAGVASYTVHVYYSRTVDAQTFSATLNKEDISGMFSPVPYTDQEVVIPLVQGQNTLVLSIEGMKKDGKKATDKDRLVFVVP